MATEKTGPDMKEMFRQAAEIAQEVPETMQEAAFNRALDFLMGTKERSPTVEHPSKRRSKKIETQQSEISKTQHLLSTIDSTKHPEVISTGTVLDRALTILQIALREHEIDGLKPSEIAKILTEKFRLSTPDSSVRMALGKATTLVNRVTSGSGYIYRIMGPGEDYLVGLRATDPTSVTAKRRTGKRQASSKSTAKKSTPKKNATPNKKATTKAKSAAGPKSAVTMLVESGFFATGRTGPEVQTHLKNKRGFNYGIDPIRVVLLRLLRDHVLERDENTDGQYEYKQYST